ARYATEWESPLARELKGRLTIYGIGVRTTRTDNGCVHIRNTKGFKPAACGCERHNDVHARRAPARPTWLRQQALRCRTRTRPRRRTANANTNHASAGHACNTELDARLDAPIRCVVVFPRRASIRILDECTFACERLQQCRSAQLANHARRGQNCLPSRA